MDDTRARKGDLVSESSTVAVPRCWSYLLRLHEYPQVTHVYRPRASATEDCNEAMRLAVHEKPTDCEDRNHIPAPLVTDNRLPSGVDVMKTCSTRASVRVYLQAIPFRRCSNLWKENPSKFIG